METKFFKQCATEQDLRDRAFKIKEILELDDPENKTLRVEVEGEYQSLLKRFMSSVNNQKKNGKEFTQEEILEKLAHLNLDVEVCGKWVWVHGNTRPHRDFLKKLNMRFSPGKKCWYHRPDKYRSLNTEPLDMDDIRSKYGSVPV